MDEEPKPCMAQSLALHEPLAGTAVASTPHWLLIERRGQWGRKILDAPELSDELRDWIVAFPDTVRHQWIRQPQRSDDTLLRAFFVCLEGPAQGAWTIEVAHVDDLQEFDPEELVTDPEGSGWVSWAGPLYVVCTHGKRDQCCAVAGMPVYHALGKEVGERVWQTSHIGGHRFAANVAVFPAGYCYGRLEEGHVEGLVEATAAGEVYELEYLRGLMSLPKAAQAAEIIARECLGDLSFAGLTCIDVIEEEAGIKVVFAGEEGVEHTAVVRAVETGDKLSFSCGDEILRPVIRYEISFQDGVL